MRSQWKELLARTRTLGFGALLGGGLLGLTYVLIPWTLPATITLKPTIALGMMIGAGLHKTIGRIFNWIFTGPLSGHVEYYIKVVKLYSVRHIIGHDTFKAAVAVLTLTDAFGGRVSQKTLERIQLSVINSSQAASPQTELVELSKLTQFMGSYAELQRSLVKDAGRSEKN